MSGRYSYNNGGGGYGRQPMGDDYHDGRGSARGGRGGGGYRGGGRRENSDYHPYARSGPRSQPYQGNATLPRNVNSLPQNPVQQNAGARNRDFVLKLGEQSGFKTSDDLPRLSKLLRDQWDHTSEGIVDGFAFGIVEQPYKLPLYAALMLCLSQEGFALPPVVEAEDSIDAALGGDDDAAVEADGDGEAEKMDVVPDSAAAEQPVESKSAGGDADMDEIVKPVKSKLEEQNKRVGKRLHAAVVDELEKRFQGWVERKEWREARIMLSFFAHLVSLSLISHDSFLSLLAALTAPLSSPSTSVRRAEYLTRIITDSLLRAGPELYENKKDEVDALVGTVKGFVQREVLGKGKGPNGRSLSHSSALLPFAETHTESEELELLETFLLALQNARDTGFQSPGFLIKEYDAVSLPEGEDPAGPIELSVVTIPEESAGETGRETWICSMTANDQQIGVTDARTPDPRAPEGFCMISMLVDIIDIFEINRVECARILLTTLSDYLEMDTFRPAPPRPTADQEAPEWTPGYWVLYSTITSVIISCLLRLPKSDHKHVYYMALIRELCALQPSNMAPPVGLAARQLYERMGKKQGLDIALAGRLSEWLSGHLSNFAFAWMWQAWSADLHLPRTHPRRSFMHRVIEQEIRLAYYDRIMGSLPNAMKEEKDVPMLLDPAPVYPYESPSHELHEQSLDLLAKLKIRADADVVIPMIRAMVSAGSDDPTPLAYQDQTIPYAYRELAVASILSVGSRSFSHFLNATERYRPILLAVTTTGKERRDLVQFAGDFWQHNVQLLAVTYDKYINNGLLDAEDILPYVFGKMSAVPEGSAADTPTAWTNGHAWDILKMLLDKVQGRLEGRRRMTAETEADHAAKLAEGMDIDDAESTEKLENARMLLDRRQREHDNTFSGVTQRFVQSLVGGVVEGISNTTDCKPLLDQGVRIGSIEKVEDASLWDSLARFGWFKEFCRAYASSLRTIKTDLDAELFHKLPQATLEEDSELDAGSVLRAIWEEATGA